MKTMKDSNKKNNQRVILGITLSVVGLAVVLFSFHSKKDEARVSSQTALKTDLAPTAEVLKATPNSETVRGENKTSPAPSQSGTASKIEVGPILAAFSDSQRKVFVSDEEKQIRLRRYQDPTLLQSLVQLLNGPAQTEVDRRNQDLAAEFLVAAMESNSPTAFASAIELMKEAKFEDATLPSDQREQLAGVAGEVIYHYLAYRPQEKSNLKVILKGPVGQKILENSLQLQNANLEESMTELAVQN